MCAGTSRKNITSVTSGNVSLEIKHARWSLFSYEVGENTVYNVMLWIDVKSNGRIVSVETYGDGVGSCERLKSDGKGYFYGDITIAFRYNGLMKNFSSSTVVKAYSSDKFDDKSTENNCGSGEIASIYLESGILNGKK